MQFNEFFEVSCFMENLYQKMMDWPQRPDYHAEGPVYVHVRMVRAQLKAAIQQMRSLINDPNSAFSNLDPEYSEEDENLLILAAYLHDLGKPNATRTVDDEETPLKDKLKGQPWRDANLDLQSLRAPKHEMPWNFNPAARELLQSPLWKKISDSASFEDKKDLWFIIKNHMALSDEGFKKKLLRDNGLVDENGKFRNTRRVKLLLTFIFMDRKGRIGKKDPVDTIDAMNASAAKVARRYIRQTAPAPENEKEFVRLLLPRVAGKPEDHQINIIRGALRGKFGRDFTDDEIRSLM